jgi:fused signal recognition particle receptor
MKKGILIVLAGVLLLLAMVYGYREYQADLVRKEAELRAADERAYAEARREDAARQTAVAAEARRLAELKARQELAETEQNLARLRAWQADAEAARQAAEEDARRLAAAHERLRHEKEAAESEARRNGEMRDKEAAEAEARRQTALKQGEKRDLADREAKRVAALKRQQELEAEKLRRQSIEPIDYRRREQYSLGIGLYGDQLRGTKQLTSPVPLR